ncbi:MAG: hypothetical protein JXB48_16230 [Candidatus Latescibacteria bacterium]|nr:hypothetical protein [Candidatus Latescibacterota bacterium]
MRKAVYLVCFFFLLTSIISAKTLTYNKLEQINLNDLGIPADERATNILISSGNMIFGATSGDRCHIFRFDPRKKKVTILASVDGPNTIFKGMALDTDTIYAGTMLDKRQLWIEGHKRGGTYEPEDANLYQIDESLNTGHLYKITGVKGDNPVIEDLGTLVEGQGIYTMTIDNRRGLIYGLTYPMGRFFIYNIKTKKSDVITFGTTYTEVSNHMVAYAEVEKDITDFTIGEGEFNNKIIAKTMHVMPDGTLYTSGWNGQILKYNPDITQPQERFSAVGYIPSTPGRQYWNRVDEIVEKDGNLIIASSDGYIFQFDTDTNEIINFGKPVRAIGVTGMVFSPIDESLYGINGGDGDGVGRFWCFNSGFKGFEVDYSSVKTFRNRPMGDIVCMENGTIVISESHRVADLWVLTPGETKEWEKTEILEPVNFPNRQREVSDKFSGHSKKLEADVYPIPSEMQGGSGYTAIQFDDAGRIYVGTAYYGKCGRLVQLNPGTGIWKSIFRTDELTGQFGRGQGIPGKIHTKLRLGSDGKIYGAMKQGWEWGYDVRPDVGESPEGMFGGQYTCHIFSYDPKTDIAVDLGPGKSQSGIVGFCVDIDRGYIYGTTVPAVDFLVYDIKTRHVWNAGTIAWRNPARYMAIDYDTGKVYHQSEATPDGRYFMSVWDPDEFRLRDYEVVSDGSFEYRHSYTITCGPVGSNKMYGANWSPDAFEMDLNTTRDGKLHVKRICDTGPGGKDDKGYMNCIELGPDGRLYWGVSYGDEGPMTVMSWDPKTETRTYLGSLTLGGEWLTNAVLQGISLDHQGNLALHCLYLELNEKQKELAHWQPGTEYRDIEDKPQFLGYPGQKKDTFYSIVYIKDAISIK